MKHIKLSRNKVRKRTPFYLGTIGNTPQGLDLISKLRILYRGHGHIEKWGRHPNRVKLAQQYGLDKERLRLSVPAHLSTRFDVYFYPKDRDWNKGVRCAPPYYKLPLDLLNVLSIGK